MTKTNDVVPFFRYTIFLITGILFSQYIHSEIGLSYYVIIFLFLLMALAVFRSISLVRSFAIPISLLVLGISVNDYHHFLIKDSPVNENEDLMVTAEVLEIKPTDYGAKGVFKVFDVDQGHSWKTNAILFDSCNLKQGDEIIFKGSFSPLENSTNPGAFDLKSFYNRNKIQTVCFIQSSSIVEKQGNTSYKGFYASLNKSLSAQVMEVIEGDEGTLAVALVLGDKENLSDQIYEGFQFTGLVHLLAVSGLHVGIIFIMISFMFRWLKRYGRWGNWLYYICVMIALWNYILLVGLQPSIVRAGLMLSLYLLAKTLKRKVSFLNIISLSAFVILVISPQDLFSIGFQFSYAAVLGIVYFMPLISQLWSPSLRVLKFCWEAICVSFAAQLATAPIAIYYFHYFPNYFLLSNLVGAVLIVPIMIAIIATIFTSAMPLLNGVVAYCAKWIIYVLIEFTNFVNDLPYAVSDRIYLTTAGSLCLLTLLIFAYLFLSRKSIKAYTAFTIVFVLFVVLRVCNYKGMRNTSELIVFETKKSESLFGVKIGKYVYTSKETLDKKAEKYILSPYLNFRQVNFIDNIPSNSLGSNRVYSIGGIQIMTLKKVIENLPKTHYVIVQNNALKDDDLLLNVLNTTDFLIFDSSNSLWVCKRLKSKLLNSDIRRVHFIPLEGAFQKEL